MKTQTLLYLDIKQKSNIFMRNVGSIKWNTYFLLQR